MMEIDTKPRGCSLKKILAHPQKKSEKSEKKFKDFLRIWNPYTLLESEHLQEVWILFYL